MILGCVASFLVLPGGSVLVPGLALVGWSFVVHVIVIHAARTAILVVRHLLLDEFSSSSATFGSSCTVVRVG